MVKSPKIKILNIISGSKYGGAELFFERLALSFERCNKIEQKIIIRNNRNRSKKFIDGINEIEKINFFHKLNPFCTFKIEKIIREYKPNILLSWMNRASSVIPNIKINNEITVGRLGGYYKIKNYTKCDYLITNTSDLKKYVISKGWDKKKVEFIPNFVTQNKIDKTKLKINKDKIILCMGRFHPNKAIDILIKAMPFLPKFRLFIVGEGELKSQYEILIKKFDLMSRVKIFEWSDNISEFLNKCSILVCPSRHEPFGNIVIEGWAHKIPVVVSDVGGPGRIVKHKTTGIKFEKDNTFDLVSKIKNLNSDKKLKRKIVMNAYNVYKKSYSEEVIVSRYLSFFRRIIKSCAE